MHKFQLPNTQLYIFLFVLIVSSLLFPSSVHALRSPPDPEIHEFLVYTDKTVKQTTDLNFFPKEQKTIISFWLGKGGKVMEPEIMTSSGDPIIDFLCFETICTLPLFSTTREQLVQNTNRAQCTFKQDGIRLEDFSDEKIRITANSFFVHRIPLSVTIQYPNRFTEEELKDVNNLIVLSKLSDDDDKRKRYFQSILKSMKSVGQAWSRFFIENPDATRNDIKNVSKKISKKWKRRRSI